MGRKLTLEEAIKRSNNIHKCKYGYEHVVLIDTKKPVLITCPIHGDFPQSMSAHMRGQGCPECKRERLSHLHRDTIETFKQKANLKHNYFYSYDDVVYINSKTIIQIKCPKHGLFPQQPDMHLQGQGCPECKKEKLSNLKRKRTTEFVQQATQLHNGKYCYDLVDYVNNHTDIDIICPIHGVFHQTPNNHLNGKGCSSCKGSHLEREILTFLTDKKVYFITQASKKDLPWLGLQSLDFYLPEYNIAIECQGEQHFVKGRNFGSSRINDQYEAIVRRDQMKLKKCKENGITLLYYSNLGIEYPYKVYEDKEELLQEILKHKKVVEN